MVSNLIAMAQPNSDGLIAMASNLLAMASKLLAMTSILIAMASNLLAMASKLLRPRRLKGARAREGNRGHAGSVAEGLTA